MTKMPTWKLPKNLGKAIEDGDGYWEDDRWSPILLTAMTGTEFNGREIPIAWQIEFDPSEDDFEAANAEIEQMGIGNGRPFRVPASAYNDGNRARGAGPYRVSSHPAKPWWIITCLIRV